MRFGSKDMDWFEEIERKSQIAIRKDLEKAREEAKEIVQSLKIGIMDMEKNFQMGLMLKGTFVFCTKCGKDINKQKAIQEKKRNVKIMMGQVPYCPQCLDKILDGGIRNEL
jgi:uncharacterized protein with PIN domain